MEIKKVKNQKEYDAIPDDFAGEIRIVKGKIKISGKRSAAVSACNNATVTACDTATVTAYDTATVTAWNNATVSAWNNAAVTAYDTATVTAWNNAAVSAWNNATVTAHDTATVSAWNNAAVSAWNNAAVTAYDTATVTAYDTATVEAYGNSQIAKMDNATRISVNGNARVVHLPQNIDEFITYHGLKRTPKTVIMYKAVHKRNGEYFSDFNIHFKYEIGKTIKCVNFDENHENQCSTGIHISTLPFALNFGKNWSDVAIIECKANIADIVYCPKADKARAKKVKVIREVPLEECGTYGIFLAKGKENED